MLMSGDSPQEADLAALVRRFEERRFRVTKHAFERGSSPDRPTPADVEFGMTQDRPRIVGDDAGQADHRGPVVTVECEAASGRTFRARLNYGRDEPVIITQFWSHEVPEA